MKTGDSMVYPMGERLLSLLFPPRCPLCGARVPIPCFCTDCRDKIEQENCPAPHILRVGERVLPFRFAVPYRDEYRRMLHQFKFQQKKSKARALSQLMAGTARGFSAAFDCVCFVPMTKKAAAKRGYNQSELLAAGVARQMKIPLRRLLVKQRETAAQHTLNARGRAENVRAVFAARSKCAGQTVLLVDDILTTGATMCACAQALYDGGAQAVYGLCLAATPYDRE